MAKELNILVTITPIYSLVKNVTGDLQNVQLLIDKNMCPHEYQLRPSDVRKINKADLLISVGEGFETFLFNYLNKAHIKSEIIKLINVEGLTILPLKEVSLNSHHTHHYTHDVSHSHDMTNFDWNFWPSPKNAQVIVQWIATKLAAEDSANAKIYLRNAKIMIKKLAKLDSKLRKKLASVKNKNFIVLNDQYQYIEKEYGLSNVGTMTIDKSFGGYSAKKIDGIRKIVKEKKVGCIFVELHTPEELVKKIEHTTGTKVVYIDVEWGRANKNISEKNAYFTMMERNAKNIATCLLKE